MPKCRICDRMLIEDATFCPGCSLENPLEVHKAEKKKISSNGFPCLAQRCFGYGQYPSGLYYGLLWVCLSVLEYYVFWLFSGPFQNLLAFKKHLMIEGYILDIVKF